jgi:hypothetical protein
MFIIDDLIKAVIDYFKVRLIEAEKVEGMTINDARKAMRKLAASLSETVAYLEAGVHKLQRVSGDPNAFRGELSRLVDQEVLQRNCHEAGVCEDLRIAQDQLRRLPETVRSGDQRRATEELIAVVDGYERGFVQSVREFLRHSREMDLLAASQQQSLDPQTVIGALRERISRLQDSIREIGGLLDGLRQKAMEVARSNP